MKKFPLVLSAILFFCISSLSSCQAIGNIFGAGFKVGIWVSIIVIIIIVVIILKAVGGRK